MARSSGDQSPSNVAHYLSGITFPCRKHDLLLHAKNHGAEGEVLQIMQELPEEEYGNMADVMRSYGEASDEPGNARTRVGSQTRHEEDRR